MSFYADHYPFKPQLDELKKAIVPVQAAYGALDDEANSLLARYNDYVSVAAPSFFFPTGGEP